MTAHPATSPSPPVLVEAGPEDVAGAGAFASGAPGAAVLAGGLALAAALLLAPGAARAADECGALNAGNLFTEDCPDAAYADGIIYWDQENAVTLTVPGTAATTTITTDADGMQDSGIAIRTNTHASAAHNIGLTVGATGPVDIVQGATPHTDHADLLPPLANSRGIFVSQRSGNGATTTVDVKSGVTIGSPTNRMKANGLHVEVGVRDMTTGLVQAGSAGAVMVTNEADIYADWNGVAVDSTGVAGTAGTTVINRGAITAGETGIGINNIAPTAGAITVINEGDIVAGVVSVGSGVGVATADAAATTVTNSGAITADLNGITVVKSLGSAGPITVTNSGAIESKSTSASANLANNGILAWSNGEDSAGANGGVSVTHSGGAISVPSGGKGIRANVGLDRTGAGNTGAARVSVTGGSITAKGGAIEAINRRAGSVQVDVSSGVALTSTQGHGIQAHVTDAGNTAGQVEITQGGRITARTGIDAAVLRAGAVTIAAGTTTYETRDAMKQPVIDVTWTGGFSHGTTATVAPNDNDRFTASDAGGAITTHRDVEAEKAMRPMPEVGTGFLRYGSPAGIEAQVMSWRDVAAEVAKGDDPGAIADNTAQMNLLAETGTGSRRAAILGAFKAALGNGEVDVADSVFDAIKTGATSLDDVTDAEIVAYLETDDAATRTLLRNVLAQGLSDEEKAVLRAVATNDGLDAALDDEDAGFSDDYKMDVKDLLNDYNVGNIRIAMNGGSINSRGDGIRAYYATPNDKNGAISVTVDDGATVTGGMAGIYVANAGEGLRIEKKYTSPTVQNAEANKELNADDLISFPDSLNQVVRVNGMVTGGTDAAVHLVGGGALIVGRTGKLVAGSSGRAILVNDPGHSVIFIDGEVQGGMGARAAVDVTGGGTITVGRTGSVDASRGDGIRAYYATPNDKNGAIDVTIAAGATVDVSDGGKAGIYVANAGEGLRIEKKYTSPTVQNAEANRELNADDLISFPDSLNQVVRVNGMVTGGTDAAVHLVGGGALIVGSTGKLVAGSSGRAILVNDPGHSVIFIDGEVRGGAGARAAVDTTGGGTITVGLTGSVVPNGATKAIGAYKASPEDMATRVVLRVPDNKNVVGRVSQGDAMTALGRVGGVDQIGGNGIADNRVTFAATNADGTTGMVRHGAVGDDGKVDVSLIPKEPPSPDDTDDNGTMVCGMAADKRCSLYEALPSVLLAMNDLPTYAERMSAARDGKGGWAQVETAGGKWKADRSTEQDVAYDHRRHGVRAGMDFAVGEAGRAGVSVHGLRGSADMTRSGGEVELSGGGLGVNATAMVAGDVHVDAQAAVTWYDVDVESALRSSLKKDVSGRGYALGVEVGRRLPVMDGVAFTPRGGLVWSKVDMDDFMDSLGTRVSVKDADSLVGRVGLMVDRAVGSEEAPGRVFGSVDVEHEFKDETSVNVPGEAPLKTTARSTGVRLGFGGEFGGGEGVVLRVRADYTTSGGDTNEYGAGVQLNLRF